MLIILAGITLNAVIGENGIIFQAKDTKNLVDNETRYDNQQLARLQNELKDNQLYSGIGIIPGTDQGGSSEGGENGTSNSQGNNSQGGSMVGTDAVPPNILVLNGETIGAGIYKSDVTIQILTKDKTQNIKYVLTSTVEEINKELYPSGLVKELDIQNGGTLTFTRDGEYTLTAYSYDTKGNKSQPTVMWIKRMVDGTVGDGDKSGISVKVLSGNIGENGWYTSNVTLRVLATKPGIERITYAVTGIGYTRGKIGETEYETGEVDTKEVEIANGNTFRMELDGDFNITAYAYDGDNERLVSTPLYVKRDASKPVVVSYTGEQKVGQGFETNIQAADQASGITGNDKYTYRHKVSSMTNYDEKKSQVSTQMYSELDQKKTYDMYVTVSDAAGNIAASEAISKPAIWISNNPSIGAMEQEGKEGARKYCLGDILVSVTGQDAKNVEITKTTYQVIGTTTGMGTIDGVSYTKGQTVNQEEKEIDNSKTIEIKADGNWEVKVHTYNKEGKKATTNTLQVTRDTVPPTAPTFTPSGIQGDAGFYSSDISVKAQASDDTGLSRITYIVTGQARTAGKIGNLNVTSGQSVNTGEVEIQNGQSFIIATDGEWHIQGYSYDKAGRKSTISQEVVVTRGTVVPNGPSFTASGTQGDTGYYRSDITVTSKGEAVTGVKKVTYTVTGTSKGAGKIGNTSVSANQTVNISETEIANNGSFTITADGNYTIRGYVYDRTGKKSSLATGITVTKDTIAPTISTPTITAGTQGEATYYRSDVTVKITGNDNVALKKVVYIVTGTAKSNGSIGSTSVTTNQSVNTGEIEIANNGTFQIKADGVWTVKAYSYDRAGTKSTVSGSLTFTRDTVGPVISSFEATEINETDFTMKVVANDTLSGLAKSNTYEFYLGESSQVIQTSGIFKYSNLKNNTSYYVDVLVRDAAGNTTKFKDTFGSKLVNTASGVHYLVDKVSIGDYVGLDCGSWDETIERNYGTPGHSGIVQGKPKGWQDRANTSNGWLVFNKFGSGESGYLEVISAGWVAYYSARTATGFMTASDFRSAILKFIRNEFVDANVVTSGRLVDGFCKNHYNGYGTAWEMYGADVDRLRELPLASSYIITGVEHAKGGSSTALLEVRASKSGEDNTLKADTEAPVYPILRLRSGLLTHSEKDQWLMGNKCWAVVK